VIVGGGANVINQYLAARLVDEIELHIVPILLGGDACLFDGVGSGLRSAPVRVVEAPGVAHRRSPGTRVAHWARRQRCPQWQAWR
jgi:riboflavin biosynthesis pyrimidine reductase